MNGQWWTQLGQLDAKQKTVLQLDATGRYFVTGPAGCGKTNLLLLRARYLERLQLANYAVLVYNGPLQKFLTSDSAHGIDPSKVYTFVSWLQSQYWSVIGPPDGAPEDLTAKRAFICKGLREHFLRTDTRGVVDTILIDEVQDYNSDEIELLGMMSSNLFLAGDIRQQIYQPALLADAIDKIVDKQNQIELTNHYRIGHSICRLADRLAKPDRGHRLIYPGCCYDELKLPSVVRLFQGSLDAQLAAAAETISQQLDAYPGEFIGVLCPRRDSLAKIAEFFLGEFPSRVLVQSSDGHYSPFHASTPIVCTSVHNSKGLEFRGVHILAAEGFDGMPRRRELIYTGVTRARTSLTIYHDAALPGFFADALKAADPPPAPPTPESLF